MKCLIVEDDPHKLGQLRKELTRSVPLADVDVATSLQEAFDILTKKTFSIVLLDMAIPSHGGEAVVSDVYSQPVGGLDVLLYLSTSMRKERVIVLTQYPTVEYNRKHVPLRKVRERLAEDGVDNLDAVVFFADDGGWKSRLTDFIGGI